jgi:hypothetical protein
MKMKFIAAIFSLSLVACAHADITTGVGVTIGSVAGIGLGYAGMYGVNRAAFANALEEHRAELRRERERTGTVAPSSNDSDNDGVSNETDVCFNVPRGSRPTNPEFLARWSFGCPVNVAENTVVGSD